MRISVAPIMIAVLVLACDRTTNNPSTPTSPSAPTAAAVDEPVRPIEVRPAPTPPTPAPADEVVTFYDRGTFTQKALARADGGDGCIGTPDQLAACKQVRPGHACNLDAPVGYWGEFRCSGARIDPVRETKQPPPPRCECTCTNEYIRRADELQQRRDACGKPP